MIASIAIERKLSQYLSKSRLKQRRTASGKYRHKLCIFCLYYFAKTRESVFALVGMRKPPAKLVVFSYQRKCTSDITAGRALLYLIIKKLAFFRCLENNFYGCSFSNFTIKCYLAAVVNQHLHIIHFYIPQFLSVCVHLHYAISQ